MPLFWRKALLPIAFTIAWLLFFKLLCQFLGHPELWLAVAGLVGAFAGLLVKFLRSFIPENPAPQPAVSLSSSSAWSDEPAYKITFKGFNKMPEKTNVFIQNSTIFNVSPDNRVTHNTVHSGIIGSGTVNVHHHHYAAENIPSNVPQDKEPLNDKENSQRKIGSKPPNKKMMAAVRKILEDNPDGLSGPAIFSHLQQKKLNTPKKIAHEDDMRSYISKIAGALRKEMASEELTIAAHPYRIVPLEKEDGSLQD